MSSPIATYDQAERSAAVDPVPDHEIGADQSLSLHSDAGRASDSIDVSVCIVNWNCRELLRGSLNSLLHQPQGVQIEVVVVDNASSDGAAEMVAAEFPEVILERNDSNRGFSRANNQAARRGRGRYLFFLNNDTVVPAETIGKMVAYLEKHPEVGLLGPRLRDRKGRPQVSHRMHPTMAAVFHRISFLRLTGLLKGAYRRYRRDEFDAESTRSVEVLMGAAMLMPREVFYECGQWDEEFTFGGEDLDISSRVSKKHQIVYYPEVEITHFGRASTRQHIGFASTNMIIGYVQYLRKRGWSGAAIRGYKLALTMDAPLQVIDKGLQFAWRRMTGRRSEAGKSLLAMHGVVHFLGTGLIRFWRA